MNTKEIRDILLEKKQNLEHELESLGRKRDENGDWIAVPEEHDGLQADDLDNANLTEAYEENLAIFSVVEERYNQINKALTALEEGRYGVCEVGGCSISEERLRANPAATTCIEHAE